MKQDESGVGGFFEDLPVLMFVLAGTIVVVLSAMNYSECRTSRDDEIRLEQLAERSVELVVSELVHGEQVVTLSGVCCTRLSTALESFLGSSDFCLGLAIVHPEIKWLSLPAASDSVPQQLVCVSSRMVNILMDNGFTGILLVRVLVW